MVFHLNEWYTYVDKDVYYHSNHQYFWYHVTVSMNVCSGASVIVCVCVVCLCVCCVFVCVCVCVVCSCI